MPIISCYVQSICAERTWIISHDVGCWYHVIDMYLGFVTTYRVLTGWIDLLTTCIHQSELHFTDHWHTQTSVLSLVQSQLAVTGNGFYRGRFFSFPRSGPFFTAARGELLTTDISIKWVLGWRPFHTNLLFFSSQADSQLTTDNLTLTQTSYFTSLTQPNWW
jgi:hypothetical protein